MNANMASIVFKSERILVDELFESLASLFNEFVFKNAVVTAERQLA